MRPTSTSTGLHVRAAALAAFLVLAGPATHASGVEAPDPDLCVEAPAELGDDAPAECTDEAPAADPTPPAEDSPADPEDSLADAGDSSAGPTDGADPEDTLADPEDTPADAEDSSGPTDGAEPEDSLVEPVPVEVVPGDDVDVPECADDAAERIVVVPDPVRTDATGEPGYALSLGEGFTWVVNGALVDTLVTAGTAQVVEGPDGSRLVATAAALGVDVENVVIGAVAEPDHTIVVGGSAAGTLRYVVDHRTPVELAAPTAADAPGREDAITVPDVDGQVVSDDDGDVVAAGTHPVTAEYVDGVATVTLSVQADRGYRLESGGLPVESLPGAAEPVAVTLTVTDEAPPGPPAPEESAPALAEPAAPRTPQVDVPEPTVVEPAAPVVTARLLTIEPQETAPPVTEVAVEAPAAPASADPQQLPETGPEGLGLMVMLGGILLGGARMVMGMRGDE